MRGGEDLRCRDSTTCVGMMTMLPTKMQCRVLRKPRIHDSSRCLEKHSTQCWARVCVFFVPRLGDVAFKFDYILQVMKTARFYLTLAYWPLSGAFDGPAPASPTLRRSSCYARRLSLRRVASRRRCSIASHRSRCWRSCSMYRHIRFTRHHSPISFV
jgi:hypothetical protein